MRRSHRCCDVFGQAVGPSGRIVGPNRGCSGGNSGAGQESLRPERGASILNRRAAAGGGILEGNVFTDAADRPADGRPCRGRTAACRRPDGSGSRDIVPCQGRQGRREKTRVWPLSRGHEDQGREAADDAFGRQSGGGPGAAITGRRTTVERFLGARRSPEWRGAARKECDAPGEAAGVRAPQAEPDRG